MKRFFSKGFKAPSARRVASVGIYLAAALIIAVVENLLPPVIPVLPYVKLGLSNAVVLLCIAALGVKEGFIVAIAKCALAAVFSGNIASLLWSLPSAVAACALMSALCKTKIFSVCAVSAAGGMSHNLVQILVASIVVGKSVFVYLPYMLAAGGIAGFLTGFIAQIIFIRLDFKTIHPSLMATEYKRAAADENQNKTMV